MPACAGMTSRGKEHERFSVILSLLTSVSSYRFVVRSDILLLAGITDGYLMTFPARNSLSCAASKPNTFPKTSSVCWPNSGASSRMLVGVFDM
jgi:hypothetical protein